MFLKTCYVLNRAKNFIEQKEMVASWCLHAYGKLLYLLNRAKNFIEQKEMVASWCLHAYGKLLKKLQDRLCSSFSLLGTTAMFTALQYIVSSISHGNLYERHVCLEADWPLMIEMQEKSK